MKALASAHETIKMFIGGSCDIGFLCSNMRIEAYGASYHVQLKNEILKLRAGVMKKIPKLCHN